MKASNNQKGFTLNCTGIDKKKGGDDMRTSPNEKGFTLIELIMVIVIIGLLATIAIPKYVSMTKDADYAAVQGMVGALNAAAAIKFTANRVAAETGNGTATLMTTPTLLGGQLDPVYSAGNYPKWTVSDVAPLTFTYANTGGTTYVCTLTAETATARAIVAVPSY